MLLFFGSVTSVEKIKIRKILKIIPRNFFLKYMMHHITFSGINTSRFPTWFAGDTKPFSSNASTIFAALLYPMDNFLWIYDVEHFLSLLTISNAFSRRSSSSLLPFVVDGSKKLSLFSISLLFLFFQLWLHFLKTKPQN